MVGWEPETVETVKGLPVVGPTSARVGKIREQFGSFVTTYLEDCKAQIPPAQFEDVQTAFREYMQAPHDSIRLRNVMYSLNNASRNEESLRSATEVSRIGRIKPIISKFHFWNEDPNQYQRAENLETSIQALALGAQERQESKALLLNKNDPYTENLTGLLTELRLTELPPSPPLPAMDTWKPPVKTAKEKGIPPLPEPRAKPTQKQYERIAGHFTELVTDHLQNNGGIYRNADQTDALLNAFGQYMRGELSKSALDDAFIRHTEVAPDAVFGQSATTLHPMQAAADQTIASLQHSIDAFHQWRENQTSANAGAFGAALTKHMKEQEAGGTAPDPQSPEGKSAQIILKTLLDSVPPEQRNTPTNANQSAGLGTRTSPQR
jgi:hypothetical protein